MTVAVPMDREGAHGRPIFNFSRLHDYGVLWLLNRTVFHPRFALALEYEKGNPEPIGWSIVGDGSEVIAYDPEVDEDVPFADVEALLAQAREFGSAPHLGPQ